MPLKSAGPPSEDAGDGAAGEADRLQARLRSVNDKAKNAATRGYIGFPWSDADSTTDAEELRGRGSAQMLTRCSRLSGQAQVGLFASFAGRSARCARVSVTRRSECRSGSRGHGGWSEFIDLT